MWVVLFWLLLATVAVVIFASAIDSAIAIGLLMLAVAGTLRQAAWGISVATVFSWLALFSCFFFAIGDPEDSLKPFAEILLHRPASLAESYAGVGLAVAPWLLCLHLLGLQKRAYKPRADEA